METSTGGSTEASRRRIESATSSTGSKTASSLLTWPPRLPPNAPAPQWTRTPAGLSFTGFSMTTPSRSETGSPDASSCFTVLAVAEEQGAARASYALKLLVSEGRLSIASTGKD
jgi:hypothetical protein